MYDCLERRLVVKVFGMNERTRRHAIASALLAASGLLVSGCMSGPTYGTDKTATEQLVGDVTGILSLAPKDRKQIDYKPRPELVKPAKGEVANLPTPQDGVAVTDNPAWPESPEQKRARLRAEATANVDKPGFRPQIENDMPIATAVAEPRGTNERFRESGVTPIGAPTLTQQRTEIKKRLAEQQQGSPASRRYLSEPPLDYRQPSATAPVGDIGEDEVKKERRMKAAARKAAGGPRWGDLWPF